jgi:hypothetical protein
MVKAGMALQFYSAYCSRTQVWDAAPTLLPTERDEKVRRQSAYRAGLRG